MKSLTPSYHSFPHGTACCPPGWFKRLSLHFKPICILATIIVSLWCVVYAMKNEPHRLADGITGLILVILGVNGAHSAVTGIAETMAAKTKPTAADAALNANPAQGD